MTILKEPVTGYSECLDVNHLGSVQATIPPKAPIRFQGTFVTSGEHPHTKIAQALAVHFVYVVAYPHGSPPPDRRILAAIR